MDHRCLYGHRVPATFAYAIQNRLCPMCGASTVTVTGYQAARKLTQEANLDAVNAFAIIRVIEGDYTLQPNTAAESSKSNSSSPPATLAEPGEEPHPAPAASAVAQVQIPVTPPAVAPVVSVPTPSLSVTVATATASVSTSSQPPLEELVVMDEAMVDNDDVIALPEPKAIRPSPVAVLSMDKPVVPTPSPVNITARVSKPITTRPAFETAEEDFFK